MKKAELNTNDIVTVTLTEIAVYRLHEHYKSQGAEGLVKYHHKVGNIYRFQFWELMRIFGNYMEMGETHYFEDNTIIVEEKR